MDLFDMGLFDMGDFSFDMSCDIVAIGPMRDQMQFSGEAAWQAAILSPFGYELSVLDPTDSEEEFLSLQEEAKSYGVHTSRDIMDDAGKCKVITVSGLFDKDSLPVEKLKKIFETGKMNGAIICVDPGEIFHPEEDKARLQILAPYIDYFFPDKEEAERITGQTFPSMMAQDIRDLGVKNVVITMGSEGCFVRGGEAPFVMGALKKDIVNTTGAGANFVAGFIYGLFQDWQMKTICEFATGCAAVSTDFEDAVSEARQRKESIKKILNNPYL